MIKIMSFFSLPIEEQRIGKVWSIANSRPRGVRGVSGTIKCLVPDWKLVTAYRNREIDEETFTEQYRALLTRRWPEVKRWMNGLSGTDELYLCCWEESGFCHRQLVAKMLRKHRPDLVIRLS